MNLTNRGGCGNIITRHSTGAAFGRAAFENTSLIIRIKAGQRDTARKNSGKSSIIGKLDNAVFCSDLSNQSSCCEFFVYVRAYIDKVDIDPQQIAYLNWTLREAYIYTLINNGLICP